jgi:hypothetical protein
MAVAEEMAAWLADEHQISDARAGHWGSLVDDLAVAFASCGPELRQALLAGYEALESALRAIRQELGKTKGAPDRSLLRRLRQVSEHLSARGADPAVVSAALNDLLAAAESDDLALSEQRARELADLGRGSGWPAQDFAKRLNDVLQRHDNPSKDIAAARRLVAAAPQRRAHIVWLRYRVASLKGRQTLAVGPRVTLFDGDWLVGEMRAAGPRLATLPPELAVEPSYVDRLVTRRAGDNEPEAVLARIEIPDVLLGEALACGRQTAQTMSALGVLYGSDPGVWFVDPSYVIYADGRYASARSGADAAMRLPAYTTLALLRDHTAFMLAEIADTLGAHLPVGDSAIGEASQLLHWLQDAQLAAPPARVLLCDRVIEQVRGWAGVGDLTRFVSSDLRNPWVVGRMRSAVSTCAWRCLEQLTHDQRSRDAAALFATAGNEHGPGIDIPSFLTHFDEISAAIGESEVIFDASLPLQLVMLKTRIATPASRRRWLSELVTTFGRAEARRRRVRNALVHGGPLAADTVEAVVGFAERLAFYALGESIEGRLHDADLIVHFLNLRTRHSRITHAIEAGDPLSSALFP